MPYIKPISTKILTLTTALSNNFCLFLMASFLSVNLLWCQGCTFYCAPWSKRYTLHTEGTNVHIQHNSVQFLVCHYIVMAKSLLNWTKHTNKEFNCVDGVYNLTKQHFEIHICFQFQLMSEQSFP